MQRLIETGTSRDPTWFTLDGDSLSASEVIDLLHPYVSDERSQRIAAVLAARTYNLTTVIEGMVDTGNVAAVMRTADGFGLQAFHSIDSAGTYKHSRRTAQGSQKWLDRYRWTQTSDCVARLRGDGYRIVVTAVDAGATRVGDVDFSRRTAIVFGNELAGVSDEMRDQADEMIVLPNDGFVESYNVSVAAGMCLYVARSDRMNRLGHHGDLPDEDIVRLTAVFMMKSVSRHRDLLRRLRADRSS